MKNTEKIPTVKEMFGETAEVVEIKKITLNEIDKLNWIVLHSKITNNNMAKQALQTEVQLLQDRIQHKSQELTQNEKTLEVSKSSWLAAMKDKYGEDLSVGTLNEETGEVSFPSKEA